MGRPRLSDRDKLARAVVELHAIVGSEGGVVRGSELKNPTRLLLMKKGFLREILKGWYFVSDPLAEAGDITPFLANFWAYLGKYLGERFGENYCLTAEHSLLRHAQHNVVPQQVNVMLALEQSQIQPLAYEHSLVLYPGKKSFPHPEHTVRLNGLRCMSLAYCLVMLTPRAFQSNTQDVQIVLSTLHDPAAIAVLVNANTAGVVRVVSAMRWIGREDFADAVVNQLTGLGVALPAELDPFQGQALHKLGEVARSPLYARVSALWDKHREDVVALRPALAPIAPTEEEYLRRVEAIKIQDAYHSLSIERYRVTPELIRKIAEGDWDPAQNPGDTQQKDAMAARGYLDAFLLVKADAGLAFAQRDQQGESVARLFADRHQAWFQKLFGTSVDAGILDLIDLVGYRRHLVFLRGSRHTPPHFDYVRDGMEALIRCLAREPDAFVRAVLGHWLFGFIHPYMDGNGRMARFLMNLMLASGGYPWTVIRVDDRQTYMDCMEKASVENDARPFAEFVAHCVRASLPTAAPLS